MIGPEVDAGDNVRNAFDESIKAGESTFFGPAYPNPNRRVDFVKTEMTIPVRHNETLRMIITDMRFRVVEIMNFRADGGGGIRWDLRDRRGQQVTAGFYKVFISEQSTGKIICSGTLEVQ